MENKSKNELFDLIVKKLHEVGGFLSKETPLKNPIIFIIADGDPIGIDPFLICNLQNKEFVIELLKRIIKDYEESNNANILPISSVN